MFNLNAGFKHKLSQFSLYVSCSILLAACGGGSGGGGSSSSGGGGQSPASVSLVAEDSISSFSQASTGLVNLSSRIHASDPNTKMQLKSVKALEANPACVVGQKNATSFEVSATRATSCSFEYTVEDADQTTTASAISRVAFQGASGISVSNIKLENKILNIDASVCESVDLSATIPEGALLDSEVIVIGDGSASANDPADGQIKYCSTDSGFAEIFYSATDKEEEKVYLGSIEVAISSDANIAPVANNFSYYYAPETMTVKVPTGESVTIDVGPYLEDEDAEDGADTNVQLIEARAANASVTLTDPDDLTNTSFDFQSDLAGTYFVSYMVTDHSGGFDIASVRVQVASPFQDYFMDTGDPDTSFTLTAPMTVDQIESLGFDMTGSEENSGYQMATFNQPLAAAICRAQGGSLPTYTELDSVVSLGSGNLFGLTGWPENGKYWMQTSLGPNTYQLSDGDANNSAQFITVNGETSTAYLSCKNIEPKDFRIRDPYYVIAGTFKDLVVLYTNSAGEEDVIYNKQLVWTSSNPEILAIDEVTGRAEGIEKGTVTVTATTPDGRLTSSIEVDVIDEIHVAGAGSDGDAAGFNIAKTGYDALHVNASNAMLRYTPNFGRDPDSKMPLKADWVFHDMMNCGSTCQNIIDYIQSDEPPAVVQIGWPVFPDATLTNALRDFLYDGGTLLYFSQTQDATYNIMQSIFGSDAKATPDTYHPGGQVFQFNDISDPILEGPFGNLRNQYWGVDVNPISVAYDLPEDQYIPFSHTLNVSSGKDIDDLLPLYPDAKANGVTALRHKSLKFVWTADAGFISYQPFYAENDPIQEYRFPLMVAEYNGLFEDGDFTPVPKENYGRPYYTQYPVSNSIFLANAVTWLFGGVPQD